MQRDRFWCHRRADGRLEHFYQYRGGIESLCVAPQDLHQVILVQLVEDEAGPLFAWKQNHSEKGAMYLFIYPSPVQIDICFPSGMEHEREAGRGEIVRVCTVEIDWISEAVNAALVLANEGRTCVDAVEQIRVDHQLNYRECIVVTDRVRTYLAEGTTPL